MYSIEDAGHKRVNANQWTSAVKYTVTEAVEGRITDFDDWQLTAAVKKGANRILQSI